MTDAIKKLWIGTSWKMNKLRREAEEFSVELKQSSFANAEMVQPFVIPPFPYIHTVSEILKETRVKTGAQSMHWEASGAWTGEVSAPMVVDCGATLVELGHSERRTYFNESDEVVSLKVQAAIKHGLLALVCIGDTKEDYDAGNTVTVLEKQVRAALQSIQPEFCNRVMFAYEPLWSIGEGGVPAEPSFANQQHQHIKDLTSTLVGEPLPVLYGGSVNLQNCCDLAKQADIDGLFIGRAAWKVENYIAIMESVCSMLKATPVASPT